jgi:hypothetical protein
MQHVHENEWNVFQQNWGLVIIYRRGGLLYMSDLVGGRGSEVLSFQIKGKYSYLERKSKY